MLVEILQDEDNQTFQLVFVRRSKKTNPQLRGIEKTVWVQRNINPNFPDDGVLHNEFPSIMDLIETETGKPFRADLATVLKYNGMKVIKRQEA